MVSALYAVLGALPLIKFSFDVVRLRTQYRVSYGDGGFSELQSAIRIHGNAGRVHSRRVNFTAVNGDGWRRNLDVARLGCCLISGAFDAVLWFSPPSDPLASFRHERDLVLTFLLMVLANPLVYAVGSWFSPSIAHNVPLCFPGFYGMSDRDTLSAPIASLGDWTFDERRGSRSLPGYDPALCSSVHSNIISMIGMLADVLFNPARGL